VGESCLKKKKGGVNMAVKVMRIDDRLIHGQIVTAWIRDSGAKAILVADDKAAKDATQKMLLQLTTPKNINLYIETIEEAAKKLSTGEIDEDLLLLVRDAKSANQLFEFGFMIDTLNVGNISNSRSVTGRTTLLSYIHVEQQDVDNLYAIADRGIKLEIRAVPSDKSIDAIELLDKKFK
jgi:mannose/fructose/N-acetylgalactosamine-specific phosphotransferase system component IIB